MSHQSVLSTLVCKGCKKSFTRKNKRQKFCTPECRKSYYERTYFPKTYVNKKCVRCSGAFSTSSPKKQVYCTPECREEARIERETETKAKFEEFLRSKDKI